MKKFYTLIAAALLICCTTNLTFAQAKKVLYITEQKAMDAALTADGFDPIGNDPIIRMLRADPNLSVTVKKLEFPSAAEDILAYPIPEIASHDVIVIQESVGGNRNLLKPGGTLGLASLTKPTIWNKNFALSNNRAVGGNANSFDASTATAAVLSLIVPTANRTSPIYRGITFNAEGTLPIFTTGASDAGGDPGTTAAKGFSFNNAVIMTPANTPLATFTPNGTVALAETGTPILINDVPAGTTITGSTATTGQTLQQRVIFLGMNFGAISRNKGGNMTAEALTIWRNAIYSLAGLTVPTTLVNTNVLSARSEVANAVFSLNQNYPNPSTGATTISFELKKAGPIALEVYDITGRKVATLADGNKAAGSHEVKLNTNLGSGIYFYKLTAAGVSASRKMMIAK